MYSQITFVYFSVQSVTSVASTESHYTPSVDRDSSLGSTNPSEQHVGRRTRPAVSSTSTTATRSATVTSTATVITDSQQQQQLNHNDTNQQQNLSLARQGQPTVSNLVDIQYL